MIGETQIIEYVTHNVCPKCAANPPEWLYFMCVLGLVVAASLVGYYTGRDRGESL